MDNEAIALLTWFRSSQRELPWRGPYPRDPYHVLISEVMLQQTQAERVAPRFLSFLTRFPGPEELARASEDDVVHAFSGLGYYRRARSLHAAVRVIVTRGGWPTTRDGLARLPGIGPYTAAAVAAFSMNGTDPPVDGNVLRVTSRLLGLALPVDTPSLTRTAEGFARSLHESEPTPEVWEALMELGATVCTPRAPACPDCPFRSDCIGAGEGRQSSLPLPRKQRPLEHVVWVAVWVSSGDGRVLLRRVADGDILGGLWLPPFVLARADDRPPDLARRLLSEIGASGRPVTPAQPVRHSITHRRISVLPFVAGPPTGLSAVPNVAADVAWVDPGSPDRPTSSLIAKLRRSCEPSSP